MTPTATDRATGLPDAAPFELLGPLPTGTTVLEASAGTGKTFTVAALVARYLAEGVATMEQLLVVSFSRDATRELRERVRERLVSARDGLADPAGAARDDEVLQHLLAGDGAARALRLRRISDALAAFDAATVTTTHGFCQQVLTTLGTSGDWDAGALLLEDPRDLIREVADDLYLRKWGIPGAGAPELSHEEFVDLAIAVATDPATPLVPDPAVGGRAGLRVRVAEAVRREFGVRKRRQRLLDYDDMLLRLRDTLTEEATAAAARNRLRSRYRVVLVDEFQDTDPVQWTILREAFHGFSTLVLIGDPKQAIYRFRGADIAAYLQARRAAAVSTLPTNWRSDAGLLRGLDALLAGAALGDERIRVVAVEAVHEGPLLEGVPSPVRLRVLPGEGLPATQSGLPTAEAARAAVVRDVAAEVVDLLGGVLDGVLGGAVRLRPRDGSPPRPVTPGDIAVLTRTGREAQLVEAALRDAGVPVVLSTRTSVFLTRAAEEWQVLLEALEQPHRATRVRRLALSAFVGRTADDLAAEDAARDGATRAASPRFPAMSIDRLALRLREWNRVLADRGVAALFEAVCRTCDVQPRVLAAAGGERLMTDLRHVAEALHAAALEDQLGLTALLTWLRRRRRAGGRDEGQERSRRLESDAAAVQVVTVHTSKGLEYPVVLVPFGWYQWSPPPCTALFHDVRGERMRDVGGPGSPGWDEHVSAHRREEVDDELRLAYVAVTRAQGHLVVWWAPSSGTAAAPVHRLLLGGAPGAVPPQRVAVPPDSDALAAFRTRAEGSDGALTVEVVTPRPPVRWSPPTAAGAPLALARFDRSLDLGWRRTSYTSLTVAAHDAPLLASEPEVAQKDDEADADALGPGAGQAPVPGAGAADPALLATSSPWSDLPGGTAFGTLVHAVLEETLDPVAVRAAVAAQARPLLPSVPVDALAAALATALATPLGPLADGRPLSSFPPRDVLRELEFELPLAGGDEPRPVPVLLSELAPLWRSACPDGPLAAYADALPSLGDTALRGYLTGSIDAVLRVGSRYIVVDYKTNRLAAYDEPLTCWHYRTDALERAMVEAHYPLQALLYSVALHRFLRWRVPGYDPQVHLGGTLYLFLRGMPGRGVAATDGSIPGVYAWQPPAALVTGASDLLAGLR